MRNVCYIGGLQAESCTFQVIAGETWFIGIHGYEAGSYSVVAIQSDANTLINGVPVTGLTAPIGGELRYTLEVPAGATSLNFQLSGGSGDADLYVRFGSAPTLDSYDCRPYVDGNEETCAMPSTTAGTWHVLVHGYNSFADVSLVGSYTARLFFRANDGIIGKELFVTDVQYSVRIQDHF